MPNEPIRIRLNQGLVLLQSGKLDEAILAFSAGLDTAPQEAALWLALGLARHQRGEVTEADRCLALAGQLQPSCIVAAPGQPLLHRLTASLQAALASMGLLASAPVQTPTDAIADRPLERLLRDNETLHDGFAACNVQQGLVQLRTTSRLPVTLQTCRQVDEALLTLAPLLEAAAPDELQRALQHAELDCSRHQVSPDSHAHGVALLRVQLLRARLLALQSPAGDDRAAVEIPRLVHLIKTDGQPGDLPLLQYLCYRSVLQHCSAYRIVLHAPVRPAGPRWEKLLPQMEIDLAMPPQHLGPHPLRLAAHQSDVWRAEQLLRLGGFYFDWDLLLLRPPDLYRKAFCVMALEQKEAGYREVLGVSMIGAQPGSVFLQEWLRRMPEAFRPGHYVAHSTLLAHALALQHSGLVRLLDSRSFYHPGWTRQAMAWLFEPRHVLSQDALDRYVAAAGGIHLFCSHENFLRYAEAVTERDIERGQFNLARLLRPYL
uniref:Uncharacterized protein n=1 Tax=uncultured microorganism TaxID=358574 RepID=F8UH09_9ZZZZ|nr:hypothetical protein LDC_03668 [uncultured microorganism]